MMNFRDGLLFLHLLTMASYLMLFGIEWMAIAAISKSGEQAASQQWLTLLKRVIKASQIALLGIFLTGGPLVHGLKPADRPGFAVTLAIFLLVGALTGISSRTYRTVSSHQEPRWLFARRSIVIRTALISAILLLVSGKPNVTISLISFAAALALGILVNLPLVRQSRAPQGSAS